MRPLSPSDPGRGYIGLTKQSVDGLDPWFEIAWPASPWPTERTKMSRIMNVTRRSQTQPGTWGPCADHWQIARKSPGYVVPCN